MSGNDVTVCGTVGRDPELRFTASGNAMCSFSIAVSRKWQNRQTNEWEEQTSWFEVQTFQVMAENVAESIRKGSRVIVSGRIEQQSWEKDGEKRSTVKIMADEVGASLRWATAQIQKNERQGAR